MGVLSLPPENGFKVVPSYTSDGALLQKRIHLVFIIDPHAEKEKPIPQPVFVKF